MWDKDRVVALILEKQVNGVCKTVDVGMTCATISRRLFGSFEEACKSAGVSPYSAISKTVCSVDGCNSKPRSKKSDLCEKHYYRMRRTGSLKLKDGSEQHETFNSCVHCGEKTTGQKYCSSSCMGRYRRDSPITRCCDVCGTEYIPDNKGIDFKVCSKECDVIRHKNYNINQKAKERVESKELYQYISFFNILKSKHVLCEVCGSEINMKAVFPAGDSFTIDHIKPLSRGGSHSPDNVRPAHLSCNIRLERGSKLK